MVRNPGSAGGQTQLEPEVRPGGGAALVSLFPRQRVSEAPTPTVLVVGISPYGRHRFEVGIL